MELDDIKQKIELMIEKELLHLYTNNKYLSIKELRKQAEENVANCFDFIQINEE